MKLNIFLFLLLLPNLIIGQTNPPPSPAPAAPTPQEDFGTTQNSIVGTQSRSFGGGSIIKPNQILNSADFVLVGSPTYETFKFRPGTSLGWGKINQGKGYGINAVLTFDLSQQSYSFYRRNKNKYYHLNFGKLGMALNTGASVTRVWELKNITLGSQLGVSIVANGDKNNKDAYFVSVPYTVLIIQKEINLTNKKLKWKPEAFITLCSPYYDIGKNFFNKSSTFNTVVGNNVSLKISKAFNFNICWRMNINTTPRWGVMNNILLGTTLGF